MFPKAVRSCVETREQIASTSVLLYHRKCLQNASTSASMLPGYKTVRYQKHFYFDWDTVLERLQEAQCTCMNRRTVVHLQHWKSIYTYFLQCLEIDNKQYYQPKQLFHEVFQCFYGLWILISSSPHLKPDVYWDLQVFFGLQLMGWLVLTCNMVRITWLDCHPILI